MQQPLRIGLIGGTPGRGWASRTHVPAYRALAEVELAAICTAHADTAAAAAQAHGVTEYYDNYLDLIQSPNVDVVSVLTKTRSHHEIVKAAIEAGKPVYSEWPLDTSEERAKELAALAKAKGLRHAVGLQGRYSPTLMHMKALIEEGFLGEVLTFNLSVFLSGAFGPRASAERFQAAKESGSGTLTVGLGHSVDALRNVLGEVDEVSGLVDTKIKEWVLTDTKEVIPVTAPDNVAVIARLKSGATGTMQASHTAPDGRGFRLEVYGTEGRLTLVTSGMVQVSTLTLTSAKPGESEQVIKVPEHLKWAPVEDESLSAFNMAQLFSRFAAAIREGRDFSPGFEEAVTLHHLIETIDRSSVTEERLRI
ncbi:MAG: scyllo-inositol 2-dehydrogenase (NAD(+)) [Nitrospira sp.]|nr:scyllo-inositol 2-dehydrogenase (NAD(+)) [Nitrospira sp.]